MARRKCVRITLFVFIANILSFGGCSDSSPSAPVDSWETRRAVPWPVDGFVQVPDTVSVDQLFEVKILTTLNGCDKIGTAIVEETATNVIAISPMDQIYTGRGVCPTVISEGVHKVLTKFVSKGEGRVEVSFSVNSSNSNEIHLVSIHSVVVTE